MHQQVYHSSEIQAWEGRWFAQQNSAYGLMQQVAWSTTEHMLPRLKQQQVKSLAVCCGQGNNAGDGYLIASYLAAQGYDVEIYAAALGESVSLQLVAWSKGSSKEVKSSPKTKNEPDVL